MPKHLSVDPDSLNHAAAAVTGWGDELAAGQATASSRISSARLGWTGCSADALTTRTTEWDRRAKALQHRIEKHANDIRTSATTFAQAEDQHGLMLRNVAAGLPIPE
jgi:WXG100 family type VII secretion target